MQRGVKFFTALKLSNSSRSYSLLSTQQAVRQQQQQTQQCKQCKHLLHSTTTTAAVNVNFNSAPSKLHQPNINILTANITNNILSNRREVSLCLTDNFTSQLTFSSAHRQYSTVCRVKSNNNKFSSIIEFCKNSLKFASNSIFASNNQNFVWKRFASSENCVDSKMAPKLAPTVKLNNGYEMPVLGLGTYESLNNEAEIAVKHAIDIGYRHIDTAYFYKNEEEIGRALKAKIDDGTVKREELFIVTKLWNIYHDPERVEAACRKQLGLLGLDYVDLYLMHLPVGYKYVNEETLLPKNEEGVLQLSDVDYVDTYKAMEKLVELGLARSIGISNFNSEQTKRIIDCCTIKPVTNQVECSPALNQKKLTAFCKQHDITVTAYSPLGRPKPEAKTPEFIFSAQTKAIADKYSKTPAQVVLRYLLDIGVIPIPKSSNPKRIEENFNVFDFQLTPEEQAVMDCFHTGERLVPFNLIKAQKHKYWPFAIEY